MRRTIWASLFALATAFIGTEARAAGDWGLHTGDTLRAGDLMPYGEFGWPDISLGLQYGLSPKVDIGGRLSLLYGWESTLYTDVGLGLRVPIRISLTKRSKFSALIHVDPGFKFYGDGYDGYVGVNNRAVFGLQFPFGAEFGIHITPDATIQLGVDLPMTILFARQAAFVLAPLVGFGFEYHIDDHLGLGLNTRFGPVVIAADRFYYPVGRSADFGLVVQLGLMYRI
jgi:hypothetical protein